MAIDDSLAMRERAERRLHPRPEHTNPVAQFFMRVLSLIMYSDTTPTRFMLAVAATCWCIGLAWPGDTFTRPVYLYMREVAPEWVWTMFWGFHACGMWWRTFATRPNRMAALVINCLGVMLFSMAAISIFLTLTFPVPAAIAADLVLMLASLWVLIRTHINTSHGWRID